jgi:hypothetical protein
MTTTHPYIKPVPGFPLFAMLSASALLDDHLGYFALRVLAILALHADKLGAVHERVTHPFIAECLFRVTEGVPDKDSVSKAVRKLIERGYVTSHGQRGFSGSTIYRLATPEIKGNQIIHPPVAPPKSAKAKKLGPLMQLTPTDLPKISRPSSQDLSAVSAADYARKKQINKEAGLQHGKEKKILEAIREPEPRFSTRYTKRQVIQKFIDYHNGFELEMSASDYLCYGFSVPTQRDDFELQVYQRELALFPAESAPLDSSFDDVDDSYIPED